MEFSFRKNKSALTLGVELEFQVLDKQTKQLTPQASRLIEALNTPKITHEFFQSTIEIISGVHSNVFDASQDLTTSIDLLKETAGQQNLCFASTGSHPQADYRERLISEGERYSELTDRNQWLIRRMAVYGMHVHLGMRSGDECILFNNFFLHFVPHLIALSASSPYWQKMDTGLASCRPTMYEALPTAGMPYIVKNWTEFEKLLSFLKQSDSIQSVKDLWWDIRPSPNIGTLEIRVCDGGATFQESMAITAFIHLLAMWFQDHQKEWAKTHAPIKRWIFRENKWRAIRYGIDASIITSRTGKTSLLKKDISNWIWALYPYAQKINYTVFLGTLENIISYGNSAMRQRKVYNETSDLQLVVEHNIKEFEQGKPIWSI